MLNPLESPAFQQMLLDMLLKLVPPHIKALLQNPEFYMTIQHKASEAYRRMALIDEMNERLKRLELELIDETRVALNCINANLGTALTNQQIILDKLERLENGNGSGDGSIVRIGPPSPRRRASGD